MNTAGRDILLNAYLGAVRQLRGKSADGKGGFCPIGLLLNAVGCPHLLLPYDEFESDHISESHHLCIDRVRERYDLNDGEWWQIAIRGHRYGYDFGTLAWMHDPEVRLRRMATGMDDQELGDLGKKDTEDDSEASSS